MSKTFTDSQGDITNDDYSESCWARHLEEYKDQRQDLYIGLDRPEAKSPSAYDTQVGGNHYKSFKIQPGTYCFQNRLNNYQSEVISYVSRYDRKWDSQTKQVEDLRKAIHTISLLIEEILKEDG